MVDRPVSISVCEPVGVLLVALYLFCQFLDPFGVDFLRLVDQLLAGFLVAFDDFVQTFPGDVVSTLALVVHETFSAVSNRVSFA
ncbi:MAG: hypothetical protein JO229_03570 [Alphaproteobacteria bacterium]|nr:hypothetical protein [Alphaproteobacteria bacterium]